MKKVVFYLTLLLLPAVGHAIHPTHMSVTNISIDSTKTKITYSIRLFQDDMNHLIEAIYHEELFHSNEPFDLKNNTSKIDKYFTNAFQIYQGNKILSSQITDRQTDEHDYQLNFEITLNDKIENIIKIKNRILLDIYSDQTNLVIISFNNTEKGISFDMQNQEQTITLE